MACTVVSRVLAAGEEGVSIATWCAEWSEEDIHDAYEPFGLIWAVRAAANRTGLELPWDLYVADDDLVLRLNDRDGAIRLLTAMDLIGDIDYFIASATAC